MFWAWCLSFFCAPGSAHAHIQHAHEMHTHRGLFLQVLLQNPHQASLDTCASVSCSTSAAEVSAVHDEAHTQGVTYMCTEAWEHKCRHRYTQIHLHKHMLRFVFQSTRANSCQESNTEIQRSEKSGTEGIPQTRAALWTTCVPLECVF